MVVPYRIRMLLPPEARVLVNWMKPSFHRNRRAIERNFLLPPSLRSRPVQAGSVWGVAMMRNEHDTAVAVVEHMFSQGVDELLIAENRSTDDTPAILADLATQHPIHVVRDGLEGYIQGAKMTVLVEHARRCGADWIVPFDADELWFAERASLADFLRSTDAAIVDATLHDVFPSPDDDQGEPNPFVRLGQVDTAPFPIRKVAFRTSRLLKLADGNMDVTRRGSRADGLFIAHFPWRTFDQMVGKLRHGRVAMAQTDLDAVMSTHWRVAGAWSDERLAAAWDDLLAGRPVEELSWSPIGRLERARPGTWSTWRLDAVGTT